MILGALAHQVSLVVWQFVPVPEQAGSRPSGAAHQQAKAIGRAFLFGKVVVEKKVEVVVEAPKTELKYKLRGVYFSPDESLSSAIVETRPNETRHYLLGDEFEEKIILAQIETDHILIDRYGKLERLDLEKPAAPAGGKTTSASTSTTSESQTALLRSYKRRYTSNPMALATRFQAIPVQQDGQNIGFKLKPLRGESLLKNLKPV
jgi:type II secretion system protein C